MEKFVYSVNAANIKPFLEKIQSVGKPDKLTLKILESMGFKSTNDRALVSITKALGLTSADGVPTERWQQYRDKPNARRILAAGIREHYSDLFRMYPDAYRQDNEALTNFFNSQTSLSARTVSAMVQTFKTLVENADFESPEIPISVSPPAGGTTTPPGDAPIRKHSGSQRVVININVQFTLPDTTNVDTYEAIFTAMKRHILS